MTTDPETFDNFPTTDESWNLDPIFAGGPGSEEFADELEALDGAIERFDRAIRELAPLDEAEGPDGEVVDQWIDILQQRQSIADRLREVGAFARGQAAAHATDAEATALPAQVSELQSAIEEAEAELVGKLRGVDEELLAWLKDRDEMEGLGLYVDELRRDARRAMAPDREDLAAALNADGLHAWGGLYDRLSGTLTVDFEDPETGDTETLSVEQAKNRLSAGDRDIRRAAFEGWEQAWGGEDSTFATILNHIVGAKETLIEKRGTDKLREPLDSNRIERSTLEALLEAAGELQPVLHEYLDIKADLLGIDELEWFDLDAPVGAAADEIPYPEGQEFIVDQIDEFSGRMGDFYRKALAEQWVEAEDRGGKAPGGYCTGFPVSEEIRVFMTYGGTMSSVLTLAHELGHAYHGWLMRDLPAGAREVPMTLAESASTLSEKLVESAALERADQGSRLRLLDARLGRALTFLVDIPARFDLEVAMHEARADGQLRPDGLREMTEEIFHDAYGDRLGSVDSHFWASKLHYFITRLPFYNFPYTFGYLFSKALHDRAVEEGPQFAETIDELLVDSGRMTAEQLADEYLGADLTDADFWKGAAGSIREDLATYRELAAQRD
jgi:pepF/M3 family oligoendopeptidase